ncbi:MULTISPECIES: isocitrate/isopropylmalate family dehydrogenase [Streptomyces]|uniref:Isocitrate dehydrogenase n=1 Tax=Streptomyces cinereoruber TaxID=67260 RepID=A0ABX6BLS4_9ACTN|nr:MULTISPECIES: isocitrate/isopropylmalate family dehydrogenase [Streptomyces]AVH93989.1 isocitrate dehydrogenase [Streptomyces sp. WAC00288]KYG51588.1 isocitrate dehydrogenase [Streptomyces sp. WAC04657]MBY8819809.1 isocitrate dehydrogenase [Streptomyces cinereoruber]QEV36268.1 isocitrate dehydrogenase [Streptomyces cinereoruber]
MIGGTGREAAGASPSDGARPVVGLAVGQGTGPELADVFERVLDALAAGRPGGEGVDVVRSPRPYHSYVSLRRDHDVAAVRRLTAEDADHYEAWCRDLAERGTTAVFRTAINAQSLYLVRRRLRAVKVDLLEADGRSLLLVRDQAQGFYTGENTHTAGEVTRTLSFSREITGAVVEHALERARRAWPDGRIGRIVMAYKFHLLDGAFDAWVAELSERFGVRIEVFQPDTVNRDLLAHGLPDRTLLIAGNEWADIMHVVLLDRYGSDRQENRCTENVCLDPALRGLVEYQTVHGSADDLAGRNLVNPVATIRAAALVAEHHAGCTGAVAVVEAALAVLAERGVRTPDLGGRHSTSEVVEALLDVLDVSGPGTVRRDAALVGGP